MTTQTSFSEKKSKTANRRFFNSKYFKFRLKTGWPLFVVFVFVFILSMGVPSVSFITDGLRNYEGYVNFTNIRSKAVEFLYTMGVWNVVISMFGGLLCGLTTMKYTNNKVAVNFYHSLPVRREALFVTSTLQSFVYYVIAFTAGLLLVFAMFSVRIGTMSTIWMFVRPIALTLEYGILFFFLAYSMTLFAASLTGTGFMRLVGTAYVVFLPLGMFLLFIVTVGSCGIYNSIIDIDYYLTSEFCILLCAPLRLINLVDEGVTNDIIFKAAINKDIIIVFVTAAVFYGLAFLLYCLRASESASQPVIWKPARFVFKYSSVFMGGTLFALMFYGMFESVPWMIFGVIIGSVILLMLTNGILNKSARAIFKGLRGFAVYMAFMAVITVVFYCDVFGIFANVPDGSLVRKVEVCLDNAVEAEYSGDFANKVTNLIKETHENTNNYEYEDEVQVVGVSSGQTYSGYLYTSMPLEAVFHTKFGIPYAVRIYPTCEEAHELAQFIYDTGKVSKDLPTAEQIDSGYVEIYLNEYSDYEESEIYYEKGANSAELVKYIGMLSDPAGEKGESIIVGHISIYVDPDDTFESIFSYVGRYKRYFITAKDVDVLNEISVNAEKKFESEDEVIDSFIEANGINGIYVVDNEKSERIQLTDMENVREALRSLHSIGRYYEYPVLCTKEHRYNVFIQTESDMDYYECLAFRKGYVPETVTALFGE